MTKKFKMTPPKSGTEAYTSIHDTELTFILKIFDFEEDDIYSAMILKYMAINSKGVLVLDTNKKPVVSCKEYYVDVFEFGVIEIKGLTTNEYYPSWKVIKEIVNKISELNSAKAVQ